MDITFDSDQNKQTGGILMDYGFQVIYTNGSIKNIVIENNVDMNQETTRASKCYKPGFNFDSLTLLGGDKTRIINFFIPIIRLKTKKSLGNE